MIPQSEVNSSHKCSILVVDDDRHIVQVLKNRLEANDYHVETAHDGVEALEKVKQRRPDLILLDILMPRMDGSVFLHKMKDEGLINLVPVIVLTAKANMREFFLVDGVVDFMVKPFEARNLLSEISKHLEKKRLNHKAPVL